MRIHPNPLWKTTAVVFICGGLFASVAIGAGFDDSSTLTALKIQAESLEKLGEWKKASELYNEILQKKRNLTNIRKRYFFCLRRHWQHQRANDNGYRKEIQSLDYGQAHQLYELIFNSLMDRSLEKSRLKPGQLFRKGLAEFRWALKDSSFLARFCPDARPEDVRDFRESMWKIWGDAPVQTRQEVLKRVEDIAFAAANLLQVDANIVVMEFACGACYALDEFTSYLSPRQVRAIWAALQNSTFVGVGITPEVEDGRLVIGQILPFSTAHDVKMQGQIQEGDLILAIDGKNATDLSPAAALRLLEGLPGTKVKLVVAVSAMSPHSTVFLKRQRHEAPSVTSHMLNNNVGYLKIALFNESTAHDTDQALISLNKSGAKSIVLDLRGNPGGLFESAIEVARRFLRKGVVTSTKHLNDKYNVTFKANNPNAVELPLAVLVNGNTASAAEVLAGALKENKRARLIGVTTYGKSCMQTLFKLPIGPSGSPTGGLRITIARFYSPSGQAYTGRGIHPDQFVEQFLPDQMGGIDQQLQQAQISLGQLMMAQQ